jgi:polyhydroxybutyrate depolymerase
MYIPAMRRIYLCLFIILIAGCSRDHLVVNGVEREYLVYEPDGSGKLPVLFVLHGNPSTGWQMKTWTGMNDVADNENFLVVYPYAKEKRWPISPQDNAEEVQYIRKVLDDLGTKYDIDEKRIYLSGMSGGGIFSFQLVRELKDTFAAFVVVAGNMPVSYDSTGFDAVPFMYVHGTEDFLFNGREELASAEQSVRFWNSINKSVQPDTTRIPDENTKDGSSVLRIFYPGQSPVVFYLVEGGGHHWPQATFDANLFYSEPLGNFNKDLNTNQAIWDFVSQFSSDE